jgi:tryptophan synthase beta chain
MVFWWARLFYRDLYNMKLERYFGEFGGMFAPESLVPALEEVEAAFIAIQKDEAFQAELKGLLKHYAGRPTPLYHAKNLSELAGANLYFKREDLLHGGAHKTNNCLGQGLMAKYLGKTRIIAETGAGQHGVATAMIGALLNIPVEVYMGQVDIERQASNVARMKLFGAQVHSVTCGTTTLKDAVTEAMRDWMTHPTDTFYCLGSVVGPHPYPTMVRYFQEVIGVESRAQVMEQIGSLPDSIVACVGGGSNAAGFFSAFLADESVKIYGAEAAGHGIHSGEHAATITAGKSGIFHGMHSIFLQTDDGQIQEPYSISAGLDYPGIGPEHAALHGSGRAEYFPVTDQQALDAFALLSKREGIVPAFESAHAVALAMELAKTQQGKNIVVNLSGRGDKDMDAYTEAVK